VGLEIHKSEFNEQDYLTFDALLTQELLFVKTLLGRADSFSNSKRVGYELEVCLLDDAYQPAPLNFKILEDLSNEEFANELAKYDLEINGSVFDIDDSTPKLLHDDLNKKWSLLEQSALKFDTHIALFGVLPNLRKEHFNQALYQSQMKRYTLFSKRIVQLREESLQLLFYGQDKVSLKRNDVMSEALCTSLQIHFQIPYSQSIDYYHAALIASVMMVGIGANSSLVMGKRAWHESRIPIFEQSTDSRNALRRRDGEDKRVHLAHSYINNWGELFDQNSNFRTIFPDVNDTALEKLYHFNLHNGTIWRWVRPILAQESSGQWTIRLELRILPAGPTLIDTEANLWFFIGLIEGLVNSNIDLKALDFETLKQDFYSVAKCGVNSTFHEPFTLEKVTLSSWLQKYGERLSLQGLQQLGIKKSQREEYSHIVLSRIDQTGASWQLKHYEKYKDINKLMEDYMHYFKTNTPVYRWSI